MLELRTALEALRDQGLTFADCVAAFAEADGLGPAAHDWARSNIENDELEFDPDHPITSRGDDAGGCWVMAWQWVPDTELPKKLLVAGRYGRDTSSGRIGLVKAVTDSVVELEFRADASGNTVIERLAADVVTPAYVEPAAPQTTTPYYLVVGRIPGADEDTGMVIVASSREEATELFGIRLYELTRADAKSTIERYGESLFINQVYSSLTPIIPV